MSSAARLSEQEYKDKLKQSTTLYVGNLSFYTNEAQLLEYFSLCGQVVNLIMGLNKLNKTPCGFCFVEYATRDEAQLTIDTLNLGVIDGRQVRIDWDPGFQHGRQFGRGKSGGQVRDELKPDFADKDRPVQRQQRNNYGGGRYSNTNNYNNRRNDGNDNYNNKKRFRSDADIDSKYDDDNRRKRFKRDDDNGGGYRGGNNYRNDRNDRNRDDRDQDME